MSTTQRNGALDTEHVDTITDALLSELLEHLHEAHELVEEHMNRQLSEASVKLADARGRLHHIGDITDALDVLNPDGWGSAWKPAGWHEAIKDAMPREPS
jgi:hypothetical protein